MQRTRHYIITTVALLLFGLPPITVGATTYKINDFTRGEIPFFFDPFDVVGTPPPSGPFTDADYLPFGTFLPGDEDGVYLNLVTGRGAVEPGDDKRVIGAVLADPYLFSSDPGYFGFVRGVFSNIAPAPGEGYGIFIEPVADTGDEAFLVVYGSDIGTIAVFGDEGPVPLGSYLLSGMDGMGVIGLTLQMDEFGVVTAFMDLDGGGDVNYFGVTTTLGTLYMETYTGGFAAFEPIPEPGTLLLLGSGLLGAAAWARRRRSRV